MRIESLNSDARWRVIVVFWSEKLKSTAVGKVARSWATVFEAFFTHTDDIGPIVFVFVFFPVFSYISLITANPAIGMKRSGGPRPPSRVRVVWDEENLHQLESTKSPKQKITEPKTPYYAPEDGGSSPTPDDERVPMDSATHAEAVRHALSGVATEDRPSSSRSSGSSWHFNPDELDDGSHPGSFEEHRRKHYDNEYKKAKLLAVDPELAVEEEEDEDAAANGEAECSAEAGRRGPPQQ